MSGSASIDDLLTFEEDRSRRDDREGGSRAGQVVRTLAGVAAVVVVLIVGLRAVGLRVSLLILIAGVGAVFAVRRVVAALAPPPPPPPSAAARARARDAATDDGTWNWNARDALRTAINGWEVPLDWSATRPERFTGVILPRLGELADERLRLKHGVTRDSDPVRARALLGERLWTFLETPPRRTPSPRDLAVIVAELEKI
ncbi:hypothetical protein ACFOOK_25940 [Micromonospora krabiensis]|uniref:Uncharacterized protein n=1 Tax=Micromonospora krabiensis TaxID=307121 RepID=A0A1C3N5X3_9ACTN|nr:hypothetical protein [Micromonospora krabiensis]SBV27992.1 hypothetical protein GA0070620_3524 [Micromonospora krabiensis]